MPGTVASLNAFRLRRGSDAAGPGAAMAASGTATASMPAAATPGDGTDRAQRFREVALPQLDAAYNLARHLLRDANAAEDIVQDAYLRALRGFDGYRGGDPRAWILRIVRNRCYDWVRERRLNPTVPLPAGHDDPEDAAEADLPDPGQVTPEQALAGADEAAAVRALVARLPAPLREALVLREMEDLSYRQIAEVAGIPLGTVMSRLARARQLFGAAWRCSAAKDEERGR